MMVNNRLLKLLIAGSIGVSGVAFAKPITEQEAKTVAVNWLYKKSGKNVVADSLISSSKLLNTTLTNESFKVVNVKPEGWVIISGDDRIKPIIGYSSTGTFSDTDLPPQLDWMLETFSKQITTYVEQPIQEVPLETSWEWETLRSDFKTYKENNPHIAANRSSKLRLTTWRLSKDAYLPTAKWGQKQYYNAFTPTCTDGISCYDGHRATGCVPTAMSEVLYYHRWPYVSTGLTENHYYNWSSISGTDPLNTYNTTVAQIMVDTGEAVGAVYYSNFTSAKSINIESALENNFDYWTQGYKERINYDNDSWHSFIKTDLRQGFPVLYRGADSSNMGGHSFVIEGFDFDGNYYDMNFGWNGSHNGAFQIDNIIPNNDNFSYYQAATFGIKPNNSTYKDRYENDDIWETSSFMTVNSTQPGHSIDPQSDADWTWFYNDTAGTVTIETINSSGDTVMRLYDYYGNYIGYDDDGGVNYLSKITRSLAAGRYYIKVESYGNYNTISSYDIRVSR